MTSSLNDIFEKPSQSKAVSLPSIDQNEFIKVIETRRSVRQFTNEPIPDQVMDQCLDLALLAPNSSNLQAWEFYWIKDSVKRKKLNEAFLSQPAATTAAEIIVSIARTKTWKKNSAEMIKRFNEQNPNPPKAVYEYYTKLVPFAYTVGFFNLLGLFKKILLDTIGIKKPIPREPVSESQLQIWAVKSAALACENLMLSMRALGYDTCPMEGFDSVRIKKLLNLPKDAVIVMGIACGKRAPGGVYGPQVRFQRDWFIKKI